MMGHREEVERKRQRRAALCDPHPEARRPEIEELVTNGWGLLSARLENKKNRQRFVSNFYFPDENVDEPKSRSEKGFLHYLQMIKAKPLVWEKAVEAFQQAVRRKSSGEEQPCGAQACALAIRAGSLRHDSIEPRFHA